VDDAGILVAHGDQGGGYSVYVEDGELHLAYNEYGDLKDLNGGPLAAGRHQVRLVAEALADFRWQLTLLVDGAAVGCLESVEMLVGFSPLEGIDVGIDRRSPVHWELYERHGAFPYRGQLHSVTYVPGARAPYLPALAARATAAATRVYE
jgi:arylsulfatase